MSDELERELIRMIAANDSRYGGTTQQALCRAVLAYRQYAYGMFGLRTIGEASDLAKIEAELMKGLRGGA